MNKSEDNAGEDAAFDQGKSNCPQDREAPGPQVHGRQFQVARHFIHHDKAARHSVRSRRPRIEVNPHSDAAIYIARIARKLLDSGPTRAISRSSE